MTRGRVVVAALWLASCGGGSDAGDRDSGADTDGAVAPDAPPAVVTCDVPALEDRFDDGTLSGLWGTIGAGAAEAGDLLTVSIPTQAELHGLRSVATFDVRGARVQFSLVEAPGPGTSGLAGVRLTAAGNPNYVAFEVIGGLLTATVETPATSQPVQTATYDATAHRHLRMVEAANTVSFEVSADAVTWSPFGTAAGDPVLADAAVDVVAADNLGAIDTVASFDYVSVCASGP